MNFLIPHVKLAGDSAKDFLSTSSRIIHIARCLVSGANAVFCRDVTRFAAAGLVVFFPIAHLGVVVKRILNMSNRKFFPLMNERTNILSLITKSCSIDYRVPF